MERNMEEVFFTGLMAQSTMETFSITTFMELELTNGLMEDNTKESG